MTHIAHRIGLGIGAAAHRLRIDRAAGRIAVAVLRRLDPTHPALAAWQAAQQRKAHDDRT
jgi:hypothetical protein